MIKIGLVGANGRMGKAITNLASQQKDIFMLNYAVLSSNNKDIDYISQNFYSYGVLAQMPSDIDVVIDFSTPNFSLEVVDYCKTHMKPLVIGTTGFNSSQLDYIKSVAIDIPILYSPNMSISVNVLFKMAHLLAKDLHDFEVEILESHHRYKKDAPSGSALKIGEIVANARGLKLEKVANFNRYGVDCQRMPHEIGFSVIRGGDIIGMHQLMFIDNGEVLSITSEVTNRDSFARGTLIAAKYIITQNNGFYSMLDVISSI